MCSDDGFNWDESRKHFWEGNGVKDCHIVTIFPEDILIILWIGEFTDFGFSWV